MGGSRGILSENTRESSYVVSIGGGFSSSVTIIMNCFFYKQGKPYNKKEAQGVFTLLKIMKPKEKEQHDTYRPITPN